MGSQAAGQQHHPAQRLVQNVQTVAPIAEVNTAHVTVASPCLKRACGHVSAVAKPATSLETALTASSSAHSSALRPGRHRVVDLPEAMGARDAAAQHSLFKMDQRSPPSWSHVRTLMAFQPLGHVASAMERLTFPSLERARLASLSVSAMPRATSSGHF